MKSYHIPKRTMILADLRSVLLDPEQWETPEEFNPNHFLDKDGKFMEREEFLPFGIGERICVGEQLARIEIFIFLTNLLRAFSFRLPEGVKELIETPIVKHVRLLLPHVLAPPALLSQVLQLGFVPSCQGVGPSYRPLDHWAKLPGPKALQNPEIAAPIAAASPAGAAEAKDCLTGTAKRLHIQRGRSSAA
ncbi:cytochrome P450 2J2-like [Crotalus adamanteus]|uniref:Cytochrome P450 2J2-like n=1 Tax=Crotalus adamanteus TaxID=8729 RepID=A0AAW1BI48_CROAD